MYCNSVPQHQVDSGNGWDTSLLDTISSLLVCSLLGRPQGRYCRNVHHDSPSQHCLPRTVSSPGCSQTWSARCPL
jgi:hypothetical protein